jgi:hypothetical protein
MSMARPWVIGWMASTSLGIASCAVDPLPSGSAGDAAGGGAGTSGSGSDASAGAGGTAGHTAAEGGGGSAGSSPEDGAAGAGAATGDAGCSPGQANCSGMCVDVMLNAKHCGACDHDCLGAACNSGLCAPQAVDANIGVAYFGLLLVDGKLYYQRGSQVCATPTATASTCEPILMNTGFGARFTASANKLYVSENGNLWRIDPSAGLVTPAMDTSVSFEIAATDSHVFYRKPGVGLVRQDQAGGSIVTLANPTAPANDFFARALATDGDYLYYFFYNTGGVSRVSTSGGIPEDFSIGGPAAEGAFVSGGYLYWTPSGGPVRALLATGTPEPLAPPGETLHLSNTPVLAEDHLYWAEAGANPPEIKGRVWRRDMSSGKTLLLGDQLDHVWGVAVDTQWVYFTVRGATSVSNGGVFRVAR